jgi:hypothetical protein
MDPLKPGWKLRGWRGLPFRHNLSHPKTWFVSDVLIQGDRYTAKRK